MIDCASGTAEREDFCFNFRSLICFFFVAEDKTVEAERFRVRERQNGGD